MIMDKSHNNYKLIKILNTSYYSSVAVSSSWNILKIFARTFIIAQKV